MLTIFLSAVNTGILAGTANESFQMFIDEVKDKKHVIKFAEKRLQNRRNSTRKKAEKFLVRKME